MVLDSSGDSGRMLSTHPLCSTYLLLSPCYGLLLLSGSAVVTYDDYFSIIFPAHRRTRISPGRELGKKRPPVTSHLICARVTEIRTQRCRCSIAIVSGSSYHAKQNEIQENLTQSDKMAYTDKQTDIQTEEWTHACTHQNACAGAQTPKGQRKGAFSHNL